MDLKKTIRSLPNWPIKGVIFRDLTTLMQNKNAFKESIDILFERYKNKKIDKVVGVDARGFVFASVLAYKLGVGFIPIRKVGKLPFETIKASYSLEYGKNTIEMHTDAIKKGERIVLVDDLLATGGTISASVKLLKKLKAEIIECAFVVELPDLKGREKIKNEKIFSMVEFEGE